MIVLFDEFTSSHATNSLSLFFIHERLAMIFRKLQLTRGAVKRLFIYAFRNGGMAAVEVSSCFQPRLQLRQLVQLILKGSRTKGNF